MIRRTRSIAVASRAIVASTAFVFATSACQHAVPLSQGTLRAGTQSKVELVLVDDTEVVMLDAHLDASDVVRGSITSCSGPSCEVVRERGVQLAQVTRMVALVPDPGQTTGWAIGTVLVLASLVGLGAAVAAGSSPRATPPPATTTGGGSYASCPRMYSWNGSEWQLDSGTFGGSLFAAAQLTDHDLLEHLTPQAGQLRMRLVNELRETEHTDAVSLRVVDHPSGTRVVPTASGKLLTFRQPEPPLVATDLRGADALDEVSERDDREWTSNLSGRDPARLEDTRDGLVLQFAKPRGATRAKLWIAARNTPWASEMLQYLLSELGPALPGWYAKMNGDPSARQAFSGFMEAEGSLAVQVQTAGRWTRRGVVPLAGPEVLKDVALEIPVDDVPGDRVTLRLDAPVAFWSVDSIRLSFEDDEPLVVHELSPVAAIADGGASVLRELTSIDDRHYSTVMGNRAELAFDAPSAPKAGMSRAYVLVSTGYYVPDVPPDPHADLAEFVRVTADPDLASRQALAMLNLSLARRLLR